MKNILFLSQGDTILILRIAKCSGRYTLYSCKLDSQHLVVMFVKAKKSSL